jgi:hypothetical protein
VTKLSVSKEPQINIYKNARLTPRSREILAHRVLKLGQPVAELAQAMGVSVGTAYKRMARYRNEGNWPCRPLNSPTSDDTYDVVLVRVVANTPQPGSDTASISAFIENPSGINNAML